MKALWIAAASASALAAGVVGIARRDDSDVCDDTNVRVVASSLVSEDWENGVNHLYRNRDGFVIWLGDGEDRLKAGVPGEWMTLNRACRSYLWNVAKAYPQPE